MLHYADGTLIMIFSIVMVMEGNYKTYIKSEEYGDGQGNEAQLSMLVKQTGD